MRQLFILSILMGGLHSCAQFTTNKPMPVPHVHQIPLGETTLVIKDYQFKQSPFLYLQLHDNENTSEKAALAVLAENGGRLLSLENNGERNVPFTLSGNIYLFDPNRVFSAPGIRATLSSLSTFDTAAAAAVFKAGQAVLNLIPDSVILIALHNNTDSNYSLLSYKSNLAGEAAAVFQNPEMDPDDFFITTDSAVYEQLKKFNYNAVLQNNAMPGDDGSLSVYMGKRGRVYINVEAEHGHTAIQQQMIALLQRLTF